MAKNNEKQRLTKRVCDAAQTEKSRDLIWDCDLQGFCLRVTKTGTKTFVVYYRVGGGRSGDTRLFTLGKYGPHYLPDKARDDARQILADVVKGFDPQVDRSEKRSELTVAELCDLYIREGCATKKASTRYTDESRIRRHITPLLGAKRLSAVKRADIERFLIDVADGTKTAIVEKTKARGKAVVCGGKGAASRTLGLLGAIFQFAINRGLAKVNPVRGVKRFPDRRMGRFLSPAEVGRLGAALQELQEEGAHPYGLAVIRLLALTGARKTEILGLQWREVDLARRALRLIDSKTGEKTLTLSAGAVAILSDLTRTVGSRYVFPAMKGESHYQGLEKIWKDARERAGLEDVRLHDLRHTFASFGAAGGFGLPVIGALLGHRDSETTARYAHLADDPVRTANEWIGGQICDALNLGRVG